jgi:hypothetical protein
MIPFPHGVSLFSSSFGSGVSVSPVGSLLLAGTSTELKKYKQTAVNKSSLP